MLEGGLAQLPEIVRVGHGKNDEPALVRHPVVCHTDSAGSTEGFIKACPERNVGLFTVASTNAQIQAAIKRRAAEGLRLTRFPFSDFEANANWIATVMLSADLVRWFPLLCCKGYWKSARPKALRLGLFHAPSRLVPSACRQIVRILDGWPSATPLLSTYRRIELIT